MSDDTPVIALDTEGTVTPMQAAVPLERKREAWMEEDVKPLRRVAKVAERHNINLLMQCRECQDIIHFEESDGGMVMECACTRRELI